MTCGMRCKSRLYEQGSLNGKLPIPEAWRDGYVHTPAVRHIDGMPLPTALSWLRRRGPELPEALLHKLFRQNQVRVVEDGKVKRISKSRVLQHGDILLLPKAVMEPPHARPGYELPGSSQGSVLRHQTTRTPIQTANKQHQQRHHHQQEQQQQHKQQWQLQGQRLDDAIQHRQQQPVQYNSAAHENRQQSLPGTLKPTQPAHQQNVTIGSEAVPLAELPNDSSISSSTTSSSTTSSSGVSSTVSHGRKRRRLLDPLPLSHSRQSSAVVKEGSPAHMADGSKDNQDGTAQQLHWVEDAESSSYHTSSSSSSSSSSSNACTDTLPEVTPGTDTEVRDISSRRSNGGSSSSSSSQRITTPAVKTYTLSGPSSTLSVLNDDDESMPSSDLPAVTPRMVRSWILYSHKDFFILNKPTGVAVHGPQPHSMEAAMKEALTYGAEEEPKLVHRLDVRVSGALVVARNADAATWLSLCFRNRTAAAALGVEEHEGSVEGNGSHKGRRGAPQKGRQHAQQDDDAVPFLDDFRVKRVYWAVVQVSSVAVCMIQRAVHVVDCMQAEPSASIIPNSCVSLLLILTSYIIPSVASNLLEFSKQHPSCMPLLQGTLKPKSSGKLRSRVWVDGFMRAAVTHYTVRHSEDGLSWLELYPSTGRKHQLRLHCAKLLNAPIVGDYRYGYRDASSTGRLSGTDNTSTAAVGETLRLTRHKKDSNFSLTSTSGSTRQLGATDWSHGVSQAQARAQARLMTQTNIATASTSKASAFVPLYLHAQGIAIYQPRKKPIKVSAPAPKYMADLIRAMGWRLPAVVSKRANRGQPVATSIPGYIEIR
eukprot:jgi/Chrzof1/243/Cz01g08160.t1